MAMMKHASFCIGRLLVLVGVITSAASVAGDEGDAANEDRSALVAAIESRYARLQSLEVAISVHSPRFTQNDITLAFEAPQRLRITTGDSWKTITCAYSDNRWECRKEFVNQYGSMHFVVGRQPPWLGAENFCEALGLGLKCPFRKHA